MKQLTKLSKVKKEKMKQLYSPKRWELINRAPEKLTPGERLRRERYIRGLSLNQTAAKLQISGSYLGAVERGSRSMSKYLIDSIHDFFGLSYDFILEGKTLTQSAINDFVRENSNYDSRHNANVLMSICDQKEADACYEIIRAYLSARNKIDSDEDKK